MRLAVSVEMRLVAVADGRTDRQTHDDSIYRALMEMFHGVSVQAIHY